MNPSSLRVILAAVVAVDLLMFHSFLGDARADALAAGVPLDAFSEFLSRPVVTAAIVLVGIAAVVGFGRRSGRLWQGLLALAALTLLSTAHTQLFGSPWRHLFFSGLCLTGWLLGLAFARFQGPPMQESYACTGSIALLGAAYLNSGISKLVYGGLTWISGLPVQSAIVAQSGLVSDGIASAYAFWVATMPAVAGVFSTATVIFELAGPLMLVGRKTRLCVALGLFGMHANIYVLTSHILYWESMVLLLSFGLSSHPAYSESASDTTVALRAYDRRFTAAVLLLAVCAVFAIGHQARRFHGDRGKAPAERGVEPVDRLRDQSGESAEPPLPPATVAVLRRIGPFAVGEQLAETWSIDSLDLSDDGFTITLSGEPGRARFDLTCSSRGSSPFDVGAAHVLYSRHVDFRDLEAVGRAVQEEFRTATKGQDVCDQLRSWRTAAQEGLPG